MKSNFEETYAPDVRAKAKKNLVWVMVFSIVMLFAGLTSGYIVSMTDNFWVKVDLPNAFYISTLFIVLSSLTLFAAIKQIKQKDLKKTRLFMALTLVLGLGFGFFQFLGYKGLVDKGVMFNTWIIVNDGRYGDYFEIKKEGTYFSVDNNQYALNGEVLKGEELANFKAFAQQFLKNKRTDLGELNYKDYSLFYKGEPLALVEGQLIRPNGEALSVLDFERLQQLAQNIVDDRADFFAQGEMGKDFKLFYAGKELDYKDRTLYYDGQELSVSLTNKLLRGNKDTASAYFYIITVLHLLHVLAGIIMLIVYVKRSFSDEIMKYDGLAVKAGSIFWHFLGVLWLYLLLFLIFIH